MPPRPQGSHRTQHERSPWCMSTTWSQKFTDHRQWNAQTSSLANTGTWVLLDLVHLSIAGPIRFFQSLTHLDMEPDAWNRRWILPPQTYKTMWFSGSMWVSSRASEAEPGPKRFWERASAATRPGDPAQLPKAPIDRTCKLEFV